MADLDKVPGMRKNGEPMEVIEDISLLTNEELIDALNAETAAWTAQGLDPAGVQHDSFALDVQIMTIVQVMLAKDIINEDEFNLIFRRNMLEKLRAIRSGITKAQITQGINKPNIIIPGKG